MKGTGVFSSNTDEWATPQDLFDELNEEFQFDLDPCADEHNHKCAEYYTILQDGLSKDWGGGECSAIRLTPRLHNGSRRHTEKERKIIPWLSFSSLQEWIQNTSTISSITGRRSGSAQSGYGSVTEANLLRFRQSL